MQFSDTSGNTGIIQMIENTTGLGLTAISGDSNMKAWFTNLINQWYRTTVDYIFSIDKDWNYDDTNDRTDSDYTGYPIATTTLINDRRDYQLPTDFKKLKKIEVKDSSGNYYELEYRSTRNNVYDEQWMQEDAGVPKYYYKIGKTVFLDPKPNTSELTASAGLRIFVERDIEPFATDDTSQEPGFDKSFQPILYYGPALEWAYIKEKDGVVKLCERMLGRFPGLLDVMKDSYAHKDENEKVIIQNHLMGQSYK